MAHLYHFKVKPDISQLLCSRFLPETIIDDHALDHVSILYSIYKRKLVPHVIYTIQFSEIIDCHHGFKRQARMFGMVFVSFRRSDVSSSKYLVTSNVFTVR